MWPTIFEFNWDTGHMIFLGVFYSVLIVIATTLVYVFARSIIDTFNGHAEGHGSEVGGVEFGKTNTKHESQTAHIQS